LFPHAAKKNMAAKANRIFFILIMYSSKASPAGTKVNLPTPEAAD